MIWSYAFASPSVFAKPALGKAEHCVMLWLGGGMSQIDTFDPKPLGDAKTKKAGGYYKSINTSVPGVQVCQHLRKTAKLMEHVTAVRSLHHDVVGEHAAATNRMHTGRPTSGTVTYPSLGKKGFPPSEIPDGKSFWKKYARVVSKDFPRMENSLNTTLPCKRASVFPDPDL